MGNFSWQVRAWPRKLQITVMTVGVSLILYCLGVKFFLMPALVGMFALYLPMPKVFESTFSRIIISFLISTTLLQVAAALLFLVWPASQFAVLAVTVTLLHFVLLALLPKRSEGVRTTLFSRSDAMAAVMALVVLLPFITIFSGSDSIVKIATIGGLQAIDAANHFAGISEMNAAQHFNYAPGYYYPNGFHIATAFIENSLFSSQYDLGWRGNTWLFFMQYILLAVLMAYSAFYFCLGLLKSIGKPGRGAMWLLALCLGPSLAIFYLLFLMNEGFLNYYYVITTVVIGALYLLELSRAASKDDKRSWIEIITDRSQRGLLMVYSLLAFGASVSWPLLLPPLVIAGLLFVIPPNLSLLKLFHSLKTNFWQWLPVLVVFSLHLLPIYFQLRYSGTDASQGINATGALRSFHLYVLLAGIAITLWLLWSKAIDQAVRRFLCNVYIPLIAFVALLAFVQYFTTGEVRYYTIKASLLLEVLLLAIGVVALLYIHSNKGLGSLKYAILLPALPFAVMVLLLGATMNPLKGVRELFRNYSGEEKPLYFDADVRLYSKLGTAGEIKHFNSTLLHYDAEKDKLFAHMQIPFWANMMQYDSSKGDFDALNCVGAIYKNLAFGTFSKPEQEALIHKIKECAGKARERGETFLMVTDEKSAPQLQALFGDVAKIRYQ